MKSVKKELETRVITSSREFGIASVLFRHAVGQKIGVNVTDMECLGVLYFKGESTPGELAEHTGLTSGATTAMLNRLEKSGLILRKPNPRDRRGSIVSANPVSASTVGPFFASVRKEQDRLLGTFSEPELRIIDRFLREAAGMWSAERKKLQ